MNVCHLEHRMLQRLMAAVPGDIRTTWPYFSLAWCHALLLPLIISLISACTNNENLFALAYQITFVVWLPAIVPVWRGHISIWKALVFVALPYALPVLLQILRMPD
jgi:hypothetical protein